MIDGRGLRRRRRSSRSANPFSLVVTRTGTPARNEGTPSGAGRRDDGRSDQLVHRRAHGRRQRHARYKGRLHHIGVGHAFDGWRVVLLVAGLEVRILDLEANQIRRLRIEATTDYQPIP